MCGQFALYSDLRAIIKYYKFLLSQNMGFSEDAVYDYLIAKKSKEPYNKYIFPSAKITPSMYVPVLRHKKGIFELEWLRWGLVPSWSKDEKFASKLINARLETIQEKPSFRGAWRARRCLIPCNYFYEWDQDKTKYEIGQEGKDLFCMAGLWESWVHEGFDLETFTLITHESFGDLQAIHHRSPLIFAESFFADWLSNKIDYAEIVENYLSRKYLIMQNK
ncbi:MAG: SOS response-associated peptidase [Candidatus Cloacimonadales bacterium]|nr:SOS response-associated peptidase [Candidatus Cloacimonadota bacterium]MDD2650486.1 SOS response-associated peptidase [Candidatus Cloacimonadota bacterium]MDD3502240.1 SOS response-associated peptidase [Candidatus Cloacimonadota bacterium]MDX9977611.1 SOS response-associated peptidase [Candidatus Cloacimonadales bacterium]